MLSSLHIDRKLPLCSVICQQFPTLHLPEHEQIPIQHIHHCHQQEKCGNMIEYPLAHLQQGPVALIVADQSIYAQHTHDNGKDPDRHKYPYICIPQRIRGNIVQEQKQEQQGCQLQDCCSCTPKP